MGLLTGVATTAPADERTDLRAQLLDLLDVLDDEEALRVLAYARCLKDAPPAALRAHALEDLLEESA